MKAVLNITLAAMLALSSLPAVAAKSWQPSQGHIMTRWAKQVNPQKALPEYPRPQMQRKAWQNLNGLWDYTLTDKDAAAPTSASSDQILVPYPYESALSGVGKASVPDKRLWYHRTFTLPAAWNGQRVLLHFGAVNWDSTVAVNGKEIGKHRGGYDAFTYDITDALKPGENTLVVSAWNPVRSDVPDAQVLGKQRLRPGGIFYTAASGIWQTVWLEPVPAAHITDLKITPDIDTNTVHVTVQASGPAAVRIMALDGTKTVANVTGQSGAELTLPVAHAHLWSPDDAHLYGLKVALVKDGKPADSVDSYFAMRKISLGKDAQGRNRIFLNNKFVFQMGVLDQGYWPDGIYTAPTDAALRYDIEAAKKLGINLLRKHAKVEPDRWYYWTDKLGMLVWQDMPQMFSGRNGVLMGTEGRFVLDNCFEELTFYPRRSMELTVIRNSIMGGMTGFGQTFDKRIARWIEQVSAGVPREEIEASGEDGLAVQEIIEAAKTSWEENRVVDVAG